MSNHALSNLSSAALLEMLGLQSKPSPANRVLTYTGFVVAGAVVGAAAALLLTPKSGRQLRSDMQSGAKELSHQVSHTAGAVVDAAKRQVSSIQNHISDGTSV
jgi:hypothetical protein